MRRCEDVRWEDVKVRRYEDEKMRRCEHEKMWRGLKKYNSPPLLELFAQTLSGKKTQPVQKALYIVPKAVYIVPKAVYIVPKALYIVP